MTTFEITFQYPNGYQQSISLCAESAEIAEQNLLTKMEFKDITILKTETTNFNPGVLVFDARTCPI